MDGYDDERSEDVDGCGWFVLLIIFFLGKSLVWGRCLLAGRDFVIERVT